MGAAPKKKGKFLEGFRRTARLYFKSKIGIIGLAVIVFFILIAVFAPYLTQNNPVSSYNVSSPFSVPAWATIFPQYRNLAVSGYPADGNSFTTQTDIAAWTLSGKNYVDTLAPSVVLPGNLTQFRGAILVNASVSSSGQSSTNPYLPGGLPAFSMSEPFVYSTKPPTTFLVSALIDPLEMKNISAAYIDFIITSPSKNYSLSTIEDFNIREAILFTPQQLRTWVNATVQSGLLPLSGLPGFASSSNPGQLIFNSTGNYRFTVRLEVVPSGDDPSISFYVTGVNLHILGNAYGLMGTDNGGRDLWSQFVWGSRISLLIGIASGVGAVAMGTILGLVAGYLGGVYDEIISRISDFFLVIPFLPLLIVAVLLIGHDPFLYKFIYDWIIALFVILSWPVITKLIRSQVLTVKERPYVEASRALGGGTGHIIRRHILPNVMGLVYSQVALNVSGFILTEAALDYLAVAIHPINTITWGITLSNSLDFATLANSTVGHVWWWLLPPGIAIAALSLAFVLVGFALDQIFNPRLRQR